MNRENLLWAECDRDSIPGLIMRTLPPPPMTSHFDFQLKRSGFALGYSRRFPEEFIDQQPLVFVVDDNVGFDILSWINSFYSEIFPVSQFVRIVNASDWHVLQFTESSIHLGRDNGMRLWSSIMVGELLALSDSRSDFSKISYSWLSNTMSLAVAKCATSQISNDVFSEIVSRLAQLERDDRFASRNIATEALSPIWSVARTLQNGHFEINDAIRLCLHSAQLSDGFSDTGRIADLVFVKHAALFDDSVERRVVAFNDLTFFIKSQLRGQSRVRDTNSLCVLLAVGAFLVGRGTSHVFLIRNYPKEFASAFVWFGFLAGLVGPQCHDPLWMRTSVHAEKMLRVPMDLLSPSTGDITWQEFSWVSAKILKKNVLSNIPRNFNNLISIELFPGIECQFRLRSSDSTETKQNSGITQESLYALKEIERIAQLALRASRNAVAHGLESGQAMIFDNSQLGPNEQREPDVRGKKRRGR